DKGSVDVWLLHDAGDVVGLDRSAVEDPYRLRHTGVGPPQPVPDRADDLLRVFGRRDLPRADGPDRLVRDDHLGDLVRGEPGHSGIELGERVSHVLPGFPDIQALTDA